MRGFSLTEILIVLGIGALMLTLGLSALSIWGRTASLDSETQRLASFLKDTHDRTLSSQGGNNYGLYFAADSVTRFEGNIYTAGASTNEMFELSRGISMTYTIEGGGSTIVFQKIKGTGSNGTVTLTSSAGSKIIDLSATGMVSVRQ